MEKENVLGGIEIENPVVMSFEGSPFLLFFFHAGHGRDPPPWAMPVEDTPKLYRTTLYKNLWRTGRLKTKSCLFPFYFLLVCNISISRVCVGAAPLMCL